MKKTIITCAAMFLFAVTMLLGTTYAWWSETIVVDENIIQMGDLDIKVEFRDPDEINGQPGQWYDIGTMPTTGFFETTPVIQPGSIDRRDVRITNEGSIPLAFRFTTEVADMNNPLLPHIWLTIGKSTGGFVQPFANTSLYNGSSDYIVLQPGQSLNYYMMYIVNQGLEDCENGVLPFTVKIEAEQLGKVGLN